MSTPTIPARPSNPPQAEAVTEPRVRRQLNGLAAGLVRGAITFVMAIALIVFVFYTSQEVGYERAEPGAMFGVGAIGFGLLIGLAGVIIGIASTSKLRWFAGITGGVLLLVLISLAFILIAIAGGNLGIIGLGWYGVVIGALLLATTVPSFLFNRR